MGLLEELAPPDAVGGTATAVAVRPTGTTGGEYALGIGRVELICSGGGEVKLLFS